ncbi:hypothetical protein [Nocardia sp. R6R-6]|uniref:hypothetical protein n=1 Tax=Nocardia sp. R6R-6 TaxID=3459303 RepID=UPI00403D5BBA
MSIVLLHGPSGPGDFLQAFREYAGNVSTATASDIIGEPVLPVTPDVVTAMPSADERLTSRQRQVEALGELAAGAGWRPFAAATTVAPEAGGQYAVWPEAVGSATPVRLIGSAATSSTDDVVAQGFWRHTSEQASRYGIDTVSLDGNHVVQAVFEHRIDVVGDAETLRHRISVPSSAERDAVADLAVRGLTACGVTAGAGHVQIEHGPRGLTCLEVLSAPSRWSAPVDASYHAFGHSHQHLMAESVLQPHAFARRLRRPPRDRGTTLAVAYLPGLPDHEFGHPDAGQLVRRLPGFTALARTPGARGAADEPLWGHVVFVHPDRALVQHSLSVLHELADSGQLWQAGRRFVDFAGRLS